MKAGLSGEPSFPIRVFLDSSYRLFYRYKAAGANAVDETGALDTVEFINVAKDDALAWPNKVHREYPSTVNARMENTIKPFVQKSVDINTTLIEIRIHRQLPYSRYLRFSLTYALNLRTIIRHTIV